MRLDACVHIYIREPFSFSLQSFSIARIRASSREVRARVPRVFGKTHGQNEHASRRYSSTRISFYIHSRTILARATFVAISARSSRLSFTLVGTRVVARVHARVCEGTDLLCAPIPHLEMSGRYISDYSPRYDPRYCSKCSARVPVPLYLTMRSVLFLLIERRRRARGAEGARSNWFGDERGKDEDESPACI